MNDPAPNPSESPRSGRLHKLNLKRFSPLIGIVLFSAALFVLHRSAETFRIHDVLRFIDALPSARLYGAVALVLLNFFLFAGYDLLALRYCGCRLPLGKVAATSMLAFSFSNVVGGMVLGGGGIRYRSYGSAGIAALDILRITAFIWMSWMVGIAAIDGVAACAYPHVLDVLHGGHLPNLRWFGVPLCLALAGYLAMAARGRRTLVLRGMAWTLPSVRLALGQIAVVGADLLLSAAILYLLLPATPGVSFPEFSAMFVLAITLALFSCVPGGLGVFEVLMLHLLKGNLAAPDILGALVVFRVIYYLLPLAIGSTVLGLNEVRPWLRPFKPVGELATGWATRLIPQVFSLAVLAAGLLMLVTGTLPSSGEHLQWLVSALPLGLFEMSHFLASIVGMMLVLFSRELQRKQYGAYVSVLILLASGIVFELVKGHALVSALVLGFLFVALLPCRKSFTRHSALLSEPLSVDWIVAVLAIVGSTVWLVFFNYRHVDYANELWWKFSLHGNASRAMRAMAGAMVLLLFFGARKLLRPAGPEPHRPNEDELAELRGIMQTHPSPAAALALLRDKAVLFGETRRSFIMYGVVNRIWVAMGEPVGHKEDFQDLIWNLRMQSDRHGGRLVFYEIGDENMALYADVGFSFFKLGEEAIVPLAGFSLEGPEHKEMRYVYRKVEKLGYAFEVVPREAVPALLPRLREISNAWMKDKGGKEKGFSLGCFDEAYLQEFPVAIVRDAQGGIVAFANLWPGDGRSELSMDLMRYVPESPNGIMDYLFISLFLWGSRQGYASFNMGMAPLAGLENHPLGPIWMRAGVWIFLHGENFYNFQGLRRYKDKFNPQWRPRYLASFGGVQLPNELIGITTLISGSARKVVAK